MSDQLWTVTHATATGEWRSWTVDDEIATDLEDKLIERETSIFLITTTGRVLIWLTPGQSLTVERAR